MNENNDSDNKASQVDTPSLETSPPPAEIHVVVADNVQGSNRNDVVSAFRLSMYACPRCGLEMGHSNGRGYICTLCEGIE